MSIDTFIEKQKVLQNDILDFLDDIIGDQDFLQKLKKNNIDNQNEFMIILYFIVNICNNSQRSNTFFSKIETILEYYKISILQYFTNYEIFHIFRSNKRILLFLIEKNVLTLDYKIIQKMSLEKNNNQRYMEYFSPELDKNEVDLAIFNENRKNGENEYYICQLIRNDSVIEFIKYINKTNTSLTSIINTSIFETNLLLLKKSPNLIEYSLFYGSIQIFQYLIFNNVQIDDTIWPYAIHGRNAEIIHYLEENGIEPTIECIKESIKCHYNEITDYFLTNYPNLSTDTKLYIYSSIKYYNFKYFPKSLYDGFLFYYLCKCDYYFIVENLLNSEEYIDINYMKKVKNVKHSYYFDKSDEKPTFLTPINAAAKKMNLGILNLLLKQKNIKIGDFCFYKCDEIEEICIQSSITSIGNHAFNGCKLLKELSIPSSVTTIGYDAFNECGSLMNITFPSQIRFINQHTFCCCFSLTKISLPVSLISIEKYAFCHCSHLKEVSIPSSLASIGEYAFFKCSSIEKVILTKSMILNNVSIYYSIGSFAFSECRSLKEISIPPSIKTIDLNAFSYCQMLTQISIPSSVMKIEGCAFRGCSLLKQILIPSSVYFIGDYAFSGCSSLIQITIPSAVNKIKTRTFEKCSSLNEIIFEDESSLISLGKYAFIGCSSLTKISLPNSLEIIKRGCFSKCKSLIKISIPSSVTYIECFAFNESSSLTEVCLSSSLDTIQKCTFKNCKSLMKIIIPSSVKRIESYAFFGCNLLSEAIILPSRAIIDGFAFPSQTLLIQFLSDAYNYQIFFNYFT